MKIQDNELSNLLGGGLEEKEWDNQSPHAIGQENCAGLRP